MRTPVRLAALLCPHRPRLRLPLPAAEKAPRQHPYLFFSKDDIPKLKERVASPLIAPFYQQVLAEAGDAGAADVRRSPSSAPAWPTT